MDALQSGMLALIGAQAMIVLVGVCILFALRIYRIYWTRHLKRVKAEYLNWILEEIGGAFRSQPHTRPHLRKIPFYDRALVRDLILETLICFAGTERDRLSVLYQIQGYLIRDEAALRSRAFGRRLAALARIEVLRPKNTAELIGPLLKDRAPMIRFAALRIAVKWNAESFPLGGKDLDELVQHGRYDTALEILCHLATARNPVFLQVLQTHPSLEIRKICLNLVIKERMIEGLPFVRAGLPDLAMHPATETSLLLLYVRALAIDPSAANENLLRRILPHGRPAIRAAAIEALLKLRPDECAELIVLAFQDPAVEVRRVGEAEFSNVIRKESEENAA